jgi:hypothetical protein
VFTIGAYRLEAMGSDGARDGMRFSPSAGFLLYRQTENASSLRKTNLEDCFITINCVD